MTEDQSVNGQAARSKSIGCSMFLGGFFAVMAIVFIGGVVWSSVSGPSERTPEPTLRITVTAIITDQRTCANGPKIKISRGGVSGDLDLLSFPESNAPCKFVFDVDVPVAKQYKFSVGNLPPVILTRSEMETSDGALEARLLW